MSHIIKTAQESTGDWSAISDTGLQAWGATEEEAKENLYKLIEKEETL